MCIWETERRPVWLEWSEQGGKGRREKSQREAGARSCRAGESLHFVLLKMRSLCRIDSRAVTLSDLYFRKITLASPVKRDRKGQG